MSRTQSHGFPGLRLYRPHLRRGTPNTEQVEGGLLIVRTDPFATPLQGMMRTKSKARWFWAWLIEMTLPKTKWNTPTARGEVWKNLVIVRAVSAGEAMSKALKLGAAAEGDYGGTLQINGKPGMTKFLGVGDMGLMHEDLIDGCEILWQLRKCRQETARGLVKPRKDLIASLESELKSTAPIGEIAMREVKEFIRTEIRKQKRKRS